MIRRHTLSLLVALLFLILPASAQPLSPGKNAVAIRGQSQSMYYYPSQGQSANQKVLFFPGDGGWRGVAITWAKMMASWGYDVYGVDTKQYLSSFTNGDRTLTEAEMTSDYRLFAQAIAGDSNEKITLMGWSQGAGMGLLGVESIENKRLFNGLIALGLPETSVLGWRFADNFTVLTGKEPNEPTFPSAPYMAKIAPLPFVMIQSDQDEYVSEQAARTMFDKAQEPKRLVMLHSKSHRFDDKSDDFYTALREGLQWITTRKN